MTEEEKLKALKVIDNFLCEEDENFDYNLKKVEENEYEFEEKLPF